MDPQTQPLPQSASTPPSQMQIGKSHDPLKMWAMLLVVLLLAAIGVAAWQTLQLNSANSKITSLESSVAELQASKTNLQTELDTLNGVDGSNGESDPDTVKILAAVDAFARAPVGATGDFEYTIAKNTGGFAKVNVGVPEGGGYIAWLKKVDANWTVVLSGQDAPSQADLDKFGIPADF